MNATHARVYLAILGVVLVAVGGVTVASPPPQLTGVAQTISALLLLFGAIGLALSATFGPASEAGLTDSQQKSLVFISTMATSLGAINTVAFGLSGASAWYLALLVTILGVVGNALKEMLGTTATPAAATTATG